MFCPKCGVEDRHPSQFCRGCGTELRIVRTALERPDAVTASASTAREEVGRALAAKIRELEGPGDLQAIVHAALPMIEKFLESPEERRLRQIRDGVITSAAGLGITLLLSLISWLVGQRLVLIGGGAGV